MNKEDLFNRDILIDDTEFDNWFKTEMIKVDNVKPRSKNYSENEYPLALIQHYQVNLKYMAKIAWLRQYSKGLMLQSEHSKLKKKYKLTIYLLWSAAILQLFILFAKNNT